MKKMNIKKGDQVVVLAGEDKGKTGRVLDVYPKQMRILVEDVNVRKKHTRPSQQDQQGGIKEISLPIHYSNVALVDGDGNATRIRKEIKVAKDGKKTKKRIAVTNGKEI